MRRAGCDENNLDMSDVMCDFCGAEWTNERPMVEGHRGACICGPCLSIAYTELVTLGTNAAPAAYECRLCLERKSEPAWGSPLFDGAYACRQCVKRSAGVLHKDPDIPWRKPDAPGTP